MSPTTAIACVLLGVSVASFSFFGCGGGSSGASGSYTGPVADSACPGLPDASTWKNVSPPGTDYAASYTGTNSIVARPDDPATVYTGVDGKGIYTSSDCGGTWSLVSTGAHATEMSSGRPWSMVIDPVTPDVMYVVQGYGASGLWKSTNAGVDWEQVLTPNVTAAFYGGGQITSIHMDPGDHAHLVVESHGNCAATNKTCAAETADAGVTWKVIDLSAVGDWSEGSGIAIVDRSTWLYCGVFSGLFRTADEGASWTQMDVGGALPDCDYYQPRLWTDPGGRTYLAAIAYTGPGILKSAPGDTSKWTLIDASPQADLLVATGTQLVVAKSVDSTYFVASQSDTSTWTPLAGPPTPQPQAGNLTGPHYLTYDPVHHVLYASTFSTGLWQTVIP